MSGRQHGQLPRRLRDGPLPVRVGGGAGAALEGARPLAAPVLAVLRRREGDDADSLPLRRARRQRAAPRTRSRCTRPCAGSGRVDTELVVYPDQWHSIETPSYRKDRYERYLAWYDRYLRPGAVAEDRKPEATSLLGQPLFAPEVPEETRKKLEESLTKATAELAKSPDSADAAVAARPPPRFTRPVPRGDRRLHAGPREAPERRAALPPPGPPVHHGARAGQGGGGPHPRRRARRGPPDEPEPEPEPDSDAARPPSTTLQFSVFYHLGLAHYLKGDFAAAEKAYRRCLERARGSDDRSCRRPDWLYMTLRRHGRAEEAARLLEPIHGRARTSRRTART